MMVNSAASTAFYKQTVPRIVYGGLGVLSVVAVAGAAVQAEPWLLGFPVVSFASAIALVRMRLRPLADRVEDRGDHLLVGRDGIDARVALATVARVGMLSNSAFIRLDLDEACPFGREVTFVAPQGQAVRLVADLRRRSAAARPAAR